MERGIVNNLAGDAAGLPINFANNERGPLNGNLFIILQALGGLGLFLLGMITMTEGDT